MEQEKKTYFENWAERYKHDLTTDIMPFWMEHGWDRKHGGVYTCVDRDGSLMDTTKSVWFQGRFAFVCALRTASRCASAATSSPRLSPPSP